MSSCKCHISSFLAKKLTLEGTITCSPVLCTVVPTTTQLRCDLAEFPVIVVPWYSFSDLNHTVARTGMTEVNRNLKEKRHFFRLCVVIASVTFCLL